MVREGNEASGQKSQPGRQEIVMKPVLSKGDREQGPEVRKAERQILRTLNNLLV
jgi:hypothetical protein